MMARYALNLPNQLKRDAEQLATEQGVSLNQFILWAVSEKVGSLKQQLDDPAGSFNFPIQMAKWNSLIAGPLKEEFQKGLLKQQSAQATGEAIGKAISDALK